MAPTYRHSGHTKRPALPCDQSYRASGALDLAVRSSGNNGVGHEVFVRHLESLFKAHAGLPAKFPAGRAIHELSRCTIGFARIKDDFSAIADGSTDRFSKLFDREIRSGADVDVAEHRPRVL